MAVLMNVRRVARLLAYVSGLVNQELLLKNEYLAAENRIALRSFLSPQNRILGASNMRLASRALVYRPKVPVELPGPVEDTRAEAELRVRIGRIGLNVVESLVRELALDTQRPCVYYSSVV